MDGDDIDPASTPLDDWLARLSEAHGAPGGGAASAVMTAISAALLGMVAAYTEDASARAIEGRLRKLRQAATDAAEEDGVRSAAFGAALAMDAGSAREEAVRSATVDAIASSVAVGQLGAAVFDEAGPLAEISNPHVEADLLVALETLRAAIRGAHVTAAANLDVLSRHRVDGDDLDARGGSFTAVVDELAATAEQVGLFTVRRAR